MELDGDIWSEDEAVVYIPFTPSGGQDNSTSISANTFPPSPNLKDVVDGSKERYSLYEEAWSKCENDILAAAKQFCAPTVESVLGFISSSNNHNSTQSVWVQGMLPTRELPTALVVGEDKQEFFDDLAKKISESTELAVSILQLEHFSNLQIALKMLIEGFIRNDDDRKRKPTTSLATYDIQLLCSWYSWKSRGIQDLKLVVSIQDLESCSPSVVHDLFHVCNKYIEQLPFVFVLGTSSSDVMTSMFSRATRSLVSARPFYMPDGHQRFESLMQNIFFDVNTFPGLLLSGKTVSWLTHSWSAYHGSLDSLLSHLQLVYLRHFQLPRTLLYNNTPPRLANIMTKGKAINDVSTQEFLEEIEKSLRDVPHDKDKADLSSLLSAAVAISRRCIQNAKLYFLMLVDIQRYLRTLSPQPSFELTASFVRLMELFGDGKLEDVSERLIKRVRLLKREQLLILLQKLLEFSDRVVDNESTEDLFEKLRILQSKAIPSDQSEEDARNRHPVSDELATLLQQDLWPVMNSWILLPLCEVWRTADRAPPLDILNPSLRSTLVSSLTQPGGYLLHDLSRYAKLPSKGKGKQSKASQGMGSINGTNILDPDICILFDRYISAGKTINTYDWFGSFAQSLEAARPAKKGKASKYTAQEDEAWRRETYGRFMWALHELDMLGFLRWTGRGTGKKGAECAGKVVWVTPTEE